MSVALSIQIEGLEQFRQALKKFPKISGPILQKAIIKSIIDLQAKTIPLTPIKTGRLRGSFMTAFSPLTGILKPSVNYAIYVHEGTRPHQIRPVAKRALYWKGADHPVSVVNHPGTRPNRFLSSGIEAAKSVIQNNFATALKDTLEQIAEQTKNA